ncbi:MAG: PA14 domain-containing protein, partial [Chitinophagaceae bacterium]
TILDFYNADGVHLNDNGHAVLFSRVAAKNIMNPVPPVKGGGLQYRYYEGEWDRLPDFNTLTAVKAGSSANVDIGVRDAGVNSNFAFVWEGMINIPVAGNYTFETNSDDGSMLYFNTGYSAHVQPLVNNDGLHASRSATGNVYVDAPGSYPIAITFFEKDGGESMQVFWSGPGIDRQLIPDNAFGTNSSGSGLRYKYYEGDFNTLPDFSSLSPVKSGTTANIEIGARPVGSNDHFAFIWEGYIHIPAPGDYTFETISDDGSKLYFNTNYSLYASAVVNNDGVHASWPVTGTVRVGAAGIYPFAVTYFEKDGGENMQVYWSGPGIARQPIPNAVLSSGNPSFSFDNTTITSKENVNRQGEKLTTPVTGETTIKRVYPSPFNETFNIEFFNMAGNNKIRVDIFDMAGRLYFSYQPGVLATGITTLKVNTTGVRMANGVYMARVSINNKHLKTVKLVKSKRSIQGG